MNARRGSLVGTSRAPSPSFLAQLDAVGLLDQQCVGSAVDVEAVHLLR